MINEIALEKLNNSSEYALYKDNIKQFNIKWITMTSIVTLLLLLIHIFKLFSIPHIMIYLMIGVFWIMCILKCANRKLTECKIVKIIDIQDVREYTTNEDRIGHAYTKYTCIDDQNNKYEARTINKDIKYNIDDQVIYFKQGAKLIIKN